VIKTLRHFALLIMLSFLNPMILSSHDLFVSGGPGLSMTFYEPGRRVVPPEQNYQFNGNPNLPGSTFVGIAVQGQFGITGEKWQGSFVTEFLKNQNNKVFVRKGIGIAAAPGGDPEFPLEDDLLYPWAHHQPEWRFGGSGGYKLGGIPISAWVTFGSSSWLQAYKVPGPIQGDDAVFIFDSQNEDSGTPDPSGEKYQFQQLKDLKRDPKDTTFKNYALGLAFDVPIKAFGKNVFGLQVRPELYHTAYGRDQQNSFRIVVSPVLRHIF